MIKADDRTSHDKNAKYGMNFNFKIAQTKRQINYIDSIVFKRTT